MLDVLHQFTFNVAQKCCYAIHDSVLEATKSGEKNFMTSLFLIADICCVSFVLCGVEMLRHDVDRRRRCRSRRWSRRQKSFRLRTKTQRYVILSFITLSLLRQFVIITLVEFIVDLTAFSQFVQLFGFTCFCQRSTFIHHKGWKADRLTNECKRKRKKTTNMY